MHTQLMSINLNLKTMNKYQIDFYNDENLNPDEINIRKRNQRGGMVIRRLGIRPKPVGSLRKL